MTETTSPSLEKWIDQRGIDVELAARLGVTSTRRRGSEWATIPYFQDGLIVNHKYRCLDGKEHAQDPDAIKCFWNVDVLKDESLTTQPLIITEGEWDAMVAMQAGYHRVMSVPDGAPAEAQGGYDEGRKYSYLIPVLPQLQSIDEIIIATDGDRAGQNLLSDLATRIGRVRCKSLRYPKGCKDLNDALIKYGTKGVVETINRARWMAVPGTYTLSELPDEPEPVPYKLDVHGLERLWQPRLGDFVVVTGWPGSGKSTLVNAVTCSLARQYGWRTSFLSPEQHPRQDHLRALRTWHSRKLVREMDELDLDAADAWVEKHFRFAWPSIDDDVSLHWVLERFQHDVIRYGVKVCVIDPWNELDHDQPEFMREDQYQGEAIRVMRRFARNNRVLFIVAAHPRKISRDRDGKVPAPTLMDISGSTHWGNKADVGIVISRDEIKVTKVRYAGIHGELGQFKYIYSRDTGRYDVAET